MRIEVPARSRLLGTSGLVAAISLALAACSGGSATLAPIVVPSAAATTAPSAGAAGSFSPSLLGTPEVTTLKLGTGSLEANNLFGQLAVDAGLLKKYGITDAEVLPFEGPQALQAAIAGQIQVIVDSPEITLTSMTTESPLQGVATFTNKFLDCLVTKPDITDAATLKGRRMANAQLGGQSHAENLVALKSLGLTDADVQIVQVGGQSARVAALKAGSVDSIPTDCLTADQLVKEGGFRILLRLPELPVPYVGAGLQFKRSFIEQNPKTVLAVTAAHLEAMQLLWTDEAAVVKSFGAWGQVDEAEAKAQVTQFKEVAQRDLSWTSEGLGNVRDVMKLTNPAVADVDLSLVHNSAFLTKLKELGLYAQLGLPAK